MARSHDFVEFFHAAIFKVRVRSPPATKGVNVGLKKLEFLVVKTA